MSCRTLVLVAGALLAAAACGGQTEVPRAAPPPASATPATNSQAQLAAWQQKGATQVPPGSVASVSLDGVQVVNQTAGKVSDADARRWAAGYLRDSAFEFWAWNGEQDQFLVQGGLSRAPAAIFGGDLTSIAAAKAANMGIQVTRLRIQRIVLRPVPDSLRGLYLKFRYLWTPYALYLDQIGPSDLNWLDGQGKLVANKAHVGAGVARPELVGGQLVTDPLMGDLWSQDSDWDCSDPASRQQFGSLCDP